MILIDANLLLLWVVGKTDKRLISSHKRLNQFTPDDYEVLLIVLDEHDSIVFCPNVLTEASNLSRQIPDPDRSRISATFAWLAENYLETYVSSRVGVRHFEFSRLGLTDAILMTIAAEGATLLTADLDLHVAALQADSASINFNHIRDQYLN